MAGLILVLLVVVLVALVVGARTWMSHLSDDRESPDPFGGEFRHYFFRSNRRPRPTSRSSV